MVQYYGRVQGVGFRATCRAVAQDFEVKGWVKNERDGSVHLIASGDKAVVDAFLAAVRLRLKGYIQREVEERNVQAPDLSSFQIKH
jgi:acylphosphatase